LAKRKGNRAFVRGGHLDLRQLLLQLGSLDDRPYELREIPQIREPEDADEAVADST